MGCGATLVPEYALKYNLIKNTKNVRCIFQLPKGNIVTCGDDGKFYIWEMMCRNTIDDIKGHSKCITSVVLIKENVLISCGLDLKMNLWKICEIKKQIIFKSKEAFKLETKPNILIKLSSSLIALGCEKGIIIFEINPFIQVYSISLSTPCISMIQLKDGKIASNSLYQVCIWHYKKKKATPVYLKGHEKSVTSLLLLKDGNMATGAEDKRIIIWDIKHKCRIKECEGHKGPVISLFLLSTGNMISGDQYSLIYIWSLDLSCIKQTLIEEGNILSFYQLRKSTSFASVSSADEVKIWA